MIHLPYIDTCSLCVARMDAVMKKITATITSKGQVTIPVEVRKHLGLKERDKVMFVLGEDGSVQLRQTRFPTLASLRGAAGSLNREVSWEEMIRTAREDHLAEDDSLS